MVTLAQIADGSRFILLTALVMEQTRLGTLPVAIIALVAIVAKVIATNL